MRDQHPAVASVAPEGDSARRGGSSRRGHFVTLFMSLLAFLGSIRLRSPFTRRFAGESRRPSERPRSDPSELRIRLAEVQAEREELEAEIAELERTSQSTRSSYMRLAAVVVQADNPIIVASPNGVVETFNPAAEAMFQLDATDVQGKNGFNLLALLDAQVHIMGETADGHAIQKILATQGSIEGARVVVKGIKGRITTAILSVKLDRTNPDPDKHHLSAIFADSSVLETEVRTDPLTGLMRLNVLTEEMARAYNLLERRRLACLSVAFLDLDHFKSINDTFGHEVGNIVLKRVAEIVKGSKRDEDIAGRYGGEELVVVLPGTDEVGAKEFAERVRLQIAAVNDIPELKGRRITASIGVATHGQREAKASTPEQLLDAADKAMYRAKHSGRNQVVHSHTNA